MTYGNRLLLTTATAALMWSVTMSAGQAADIGDGCCADLEERIAELETTTARKGNRVVSLQVSGQVNRALLIWDDGIDSDAYVVDPDSDGSRFRFTGTAALKPGWQAGYVLELTTVDSASNFVSQLDDEGLSEILRLRRNSLYIESEQLGRLTIGQENQATDGINEIDVVGTYSTVSKTHYAGGFFVRTFDGDLDGDELRWQDVLGAIGGGQEDIIRYDTPSIYGFIVSASWGDDDIWDVALRFQKEFNSIRIAAGIGYLEDDRDDDVSRTDNQLSGSASAIHVPTGLFVTVAAGSRSFKDDSPDAENWYIKGGISKNWFSHGATTLFVDYAQFENFGVGQEFDLDGGIVLDELTSSEASVIGFGVVQSFDSAALNIYALAQFFDSDLEGDFESLDTEDHFAIILGSHIRF
jgi:predicted porin